MKSKLNLDYLGEYSKSNAIIKETNRTSQDSIIIVYTYDSLPLISEKKFNNFKK